MNLTLLTCNYNTPGLIVNLLKSLKHTSSNLPKVVVMNTSTIDSDDLKKYGIPYYNFRGGIHGEAINLGLTKITTRYVLLVDSDVLFLKDFSPAFEKFKSSNLALMGKVVGDCAGKSLYPRVEPWYCFMDLYQLKQHKIKFFDRERTERSKARLTNPPRVYDIGSTMFEDITKENLLIGDVNLENKFFKHYGGMSWRAKKYDPFQADTDIDFGGTHPHKCLFDLGLYIEQLYFKETEYLVPIDIKNIFQ